MFEKLLQLLSGKPHTTSFIQTEKEAALELLIIVMYADYSITIEENTKLSELSDEIGWDSPVNYDRFIGETLARVRNLESNESVASRISELAAKLDTPSLDITIAMCETLSEADGSLDIEELKIQKQLYDIRAAR